MTEVKQTITLATPALTAPCFICGPGVSSMDAAWEFIRAGQLPVWGSLLMESQSGGRGRMGRVWQSPPGHVYGALRLPLEAPFTEAGASLVLAVLMIEALAELGLEVGLKWPNDLIYQGGKTGGLLLEVKALPRRSNAPPQFSGGLNVSAGNERDSSLAPNEGLVAGIGLNLGSPPSGDWVKQRESGAPRPSALPFPGGPERLWPALVKNLIIMYSNRLDKAVKGRPSPFPAMAEFSRAAERYLIWRGRTVRIITPAADPPAPPEGLRGVISGLGPDGQLVLDCPGGRYELWSGTVCLEGNL